MLDLTPKKIYYLQNPSRLWINPQDKFIENRADLKLTQFMSLGSSIEDILLWTLADLEIRSIIELNCKDWLFITVEYVENFKNDKYSIEQGKAYKLTNIITNWRYEINKTLDELHSKFEGAIQEHEYNSSIVNLTPQVMINKGFLQSEVKEDYSYINIGSPMKLYDKLDYLENRYNSAMKKSNGTLEYYPLNEYYNIDSYIKLQNKVNPEAYD